MAARRATEKRIFDGVEEPEGGGEVEGPARMSGPLSAPRYVTLARNWRRCS